MFGSGENTVAPTIVFPSRSFCFAVLNIRIGAFCCCACAPPKAIQDTATQIVVSEREYRAFIGVSPCGKAIASDRRNDTTPLSFGERITVSPEGRLAAAFLPPAFFAFSERAFHSLASA